MDLDGSCGDSWLFRPIDSDHSEAFWSILNPNFESRNIIQIMRHFSMHHTWMVDGPPWSTCSSFPRNSVTCQRQFTHSLRVHVVPVSTESVETNWLDSGFDSKKKQHGTNPSEGHWQIAMPNSSSTPQAPSEFQLDDTWVKKAAFVPKLSAARWYTDCSQGICIFRIVWLFTAPKTEQQRKSLSLLLDPGSKLFLDDVVALSKAKQADWKGLSNLLIPQQTLNFPPASVSSQSYPLVIADIADIAMDNHHFNIGKSSMTEAFSISYVKLPKGKLCEESEDIWGVCSKMS